MIPLWILTDDAGMSELFANLGDCLVAQSDLMVYGIRTSVRLLKITIPQHSCNNHLN